MALETVELGPKDGAGTLIWLHGLGADGHDFEGLVPHLRRPDLRVVLPHAPVRPVTLNGGYPMRAWYDIRHLEPGPNRESAEDIRAISHEIQALIDAEIAAGTPASRILLVGFSQGGAMALHVGLRCPQRLGGLVALSTYLTLEAELDAERSAESISIPAFFAHGSRDPTVPMARGRAAYDRLASSLQASWHSYPMGHELCLEELHALRAFLDRVLPSNTSAP
jgi:phospholipase/carboxylesterase